MKSFAGFCFMLLFVVPVMSQQDSTDMIPPVVQLDNIDRSLKAATAMSIISTVYAATGLVLAGAMLTDQVWAQRARAAALTFGIGGIGMQTNVPILTRRAYWQINSYPFPETDLPLKLSMMKELKVARSLSQLQAFMPLIGLASGLICRFAVTGEKESQDAFVYAFLGAAAAGLVMAIPQVVLMEHVRGQVCRYKRQVNLGMTENGAGLVYHF